jgi:hypothetical protein
MLRQSYTFLGLVFYGPEAENRARLVPFEQAKSELEDVVKQDLQTRVGGKSYSAVYLHLPPAPLETSTAQQLAESWLLFIEATVPILEQVVADLGLGVRTQKPKEQELERPRAILAREIRNIRAYLQGDQALSPTDEKLCEWIQFCYTFELWTEGTALFKLVRPDAVNAWLYKRTGKLARACELHGRG